MRIDDFKLERYFAKYEFNTKYMLGSSDCESLTVRELLDMEPGADEQLKDSWLGYTETPGAPRLREEIAKLYETMSPDDIVVFAGAQEAIFIYMNVVMEPGRSVIAQVPAYQSLFEVARAIGCRFIPWKLDFQNGWDANPAFLEKNNCGPLKALVINFPHNPTGAYPSPGQFDRVIDFARGSNLYLFSDEVYRFHNYAGVPALPAACDRYDKAVSLGVMSKSFGLAGLRIGWLASKDRELMEKIIAYKDYTTICSSAPSEFLATLALKHKEKIIQRNLDIITENLGLLDDFFKRYDELFHWVRPKAGPIAFPAFKDGGDCAGFCKQMAEKQGVMVLPGFLYNWDEEPVYNSHFRIGFGRKDMPEALKQFESCL